MYFSWHVKHIYTHHTCINLFTFIPVAFITSFHCCKATLHKNTLSKKRQKQYRNKAKEQKYDEIRAFLKSSVAHIIAVLPKPRMCPNWLFRRLHTVLLKLTALLIFFVVWIFVKSSDKRKGWVNNDDKNREIWGCNVLEGLQRYNNVCYVVPLFFIIIIFTVIQWLHIK